MRTFNKILSNLYPSNPCAHFSIIAKSEALGYGKPTTFEGCLETQRVADISN